MDPIRDAAMFPKSSGQSPLQNVNMPDSILHRVANSSSQMFGIDDLVAWTD